MFHDQVSAEIDSLLNEKPEGVSTRIYDNLTIVDQKEVPSASPDPDEGADYARATSTPLKPYLVYTNAPVPGAFIGYTTTTQYKTFSNLSYTSSPSTSTSTTLPHSANEDDQQVLKHKHEHKHHRGYNFAKKISRLIKPSHHHGQSETRNHLQAQETPPTTITPPPSPEALVPIPLGEESIDDNSQISVTQEEIWKIMVPDYTTLNHKWYSSEGEAEEEGSESDSSTPDSMSTDGIPDLTEMNIDISECIECTRATISTSDSYYSSPSSPTDATDTSSSLAKRARHFAEHFHRREHLPPHHPPHHLPHHPPHAHHHYTHRSLHKHAHALHARIRAHHIQEVEPIDNVEEWERRGKGIPYSVALPTYAQKTRVKYVRVLYNPESGARKGTQMMEEARDFFEASGVRVEPVELERRGHAEELCQYMSLADVDVLCVLGGDGTFHECINGIMKRTDDERLRVPICALPAGTGNSFVRELQGSVDLTIACKRVLRGVHFPIDIAKIEMLNDREVIYGFNSIHWGLASKVNVTAEKLRWMGKAIRYTTAALLELVRGEKTLAKITLEDKMGNITEYCEEFCLVIANNILTAAKGMKMAPNAKINDGLIDLLLFRSHHAVDLMQVFARTYDGTHVDLSHVEYKQVRSFTITPFREPESDNLPEVAEELVDIDGELKGLTPFSCTMLPRAVRVIL